MNRARFENCIEQFRTELWIAKEFESILPGEAEGFDLKQLGHNRPDTLHILAEAMKLTLADRDVYFADPLFVDVARRHLRIPTHLNV